MSGEIAGCHTSGFDGTPEPHHIAVEVKDRPKFSWVGFGYRWVCSCGKVGNFWETDPERAYKSGGQHSAEKKGIEVDSEG